MSADLFAELNPEQQRAVKTTEGPVLILAGAGSGKTKALTYRIAYLINQNLAEPQNILAVTFTNKAAKEMRQRVAVLLGQNPEYKGFMPYMGTFHSICVRLLRQDGDYIGLNPKFVIFDEADRKALVRQITKQLKIDEKQFPPAIIANIISSAKNELITPVEYEGLANSPKQKVAARIFPLYQKELQRQCGLDFDDLIGRTVGLLKNHTAVRNKWTQQFKYVLIDEYQDTNSAQYKLIKLLTNDKHNVCVVGDDWQCLVSGSLVETQDGLKKIENIVEGELVRSAGGYTKTGYFKVLSQKKYQYKGEVIKIKTDSGRELICTPNHLLFTRWSTSDAYFVYLMYAQNKGYRIGMAKGTRFDGKKYDTGLRVRANQERADRMWVLKVCDKRTEARYYENLFAYKYGIPMLVFHAFSNRFMQLSQKQLDTIYKEIDTKKRAQELMADLGLAFDYPHFSPQATVRNDIKRLSLKVVLFGDKRVTGVSPFSASRISANTTDRQDLHVFEKLGYTIRTGRAGTFRSEISHLDYGKIESIVERIKEENISELQINRYSFMTDKKFHFMPASQIHPGMIVPASKGNTVIEDRVVDVSKQTYSGLVYDLDIEKVHNYIASGIAVHNSIYSWRGADFRNILNFEKDYPKSTIIKLEQNYRSTKHILDAAHAVITKNLKRSDKKLWTAAGPGQPVQMVPVANERAEGEAIIRCIQTQVDMQLRKYSDFAVLYRTNAQSRSLEEQFVRYGIPYKIVGNVRFYDRAEIKDILAYLRLIYQPEDLVSFNRIINVPTRGLGPKSIQNFLDWRLANGATLDEALTRADEIVLTQKAKEAFLGFADIIKTFRLESEEMPVATLLDSLLRRLDYLKYLDDGSIQAETRAENVRELLSVAKEYSEFGLASFLEEVALVSELDNLKDSHNAVTLMTLHSAKGLEFPVVFMAGLEESLLPHAQALFDQSEMEEERRLCYVGMTRAREELFMLFARSRILYGGVQHNPPSRFLSEIDSQFQTHASLIGASFMSDSGEQIPFEEINEPNNNLELEVGDTVRHQLFGIGTVTEVEGDNVAVYFKGKGAKKLNIAFAPLEKL
ncbi:MAG TPA: UvrD-helicase domain-containing protein [Patescibacteria group bacterium]|nr:UvrD-helicase domain-containing protein [Patescibacteria group bacterium]